MNDNSNRRKALCITLLAAAAAIILYKVLPSFQNPDRFVKDVMNQSVLLVFALIAALVTKKLGVLKISGKGFKEGFSAGNYFLIVSAGNLILWIFSLIHGDTNISVPAVSILLFAVFCLMIGISEELLFRGVLYEGLHDYFGNSAASVRKAVIIAGIIFGSIHLLNLTDGSDIAYGVINALINIADGILYCTVFVYAGGNIWPSILLHAFRDAVSYLSDGILCAATSAGANAARIGVPLSILIRMLIIAALVFAMDYYLLQDKNLLPVLGASAENSGTDSK